MKVGYSTIDITPEIGIELSGYGWFLGRKAESVLDPLYARAIAMEHDGKELLLINCDLIAMTKPISDYVRDRLSDEIGIDRLCIMISATHTHTGPSLGGIVGCGETDEQYLSRLPELLFQVGRSAFQKLRQVETAKSFIQTIEPVGKNRTIKDGPVYDKVQGIVFEFTEGKPLVIISYGCHPVTLGPATVISADYPGKVVQVLCQEGYDGIFLNGFNGDINPISNGKKWDYDREAMLYEHGRKIAEGYLLHKDQAVPMTDMCLDAFDMDIELKLQNYRLDDIEREVEKFKAKRDQEPEVYRIVQMWAEKVKKQLETSDNPYSEPITVHVFVIGNIMLVGFPAEVYTEIGLTIREAVPGMNIIPLSNVNGKTRYIPTRDEIEKKSYSAYISSYAYLKFPLVPGEGERIGELIKTLLKTRWESN